MKIVISTGCTSFYTLVDGRSLDDVNIDEVLDVILPQIRKGVKAGEIQFDSVVRLFQCTDIETDATTCDQCGDTVYRELYDINEESK